MKSDAPRVSTSPAKEKTVWEHSPTRRKYGEILHLNRGAPLFKHSVTVPQCYQGSTIPVGPPPTCLPCGTPHGRPRGPRDGVASCHVAAPLCASCAPCGPPGLCLMASVPRRTPWRSRAPRQPLATSAAAWARSPRQPAGNNPFFSRFLIENTSKI